MKPAQPRVIGVGTTCYVTTTDNKTVLKGHQVWFSGNLVFDCRDSCEERLAREATIYQHLGRHPQNLECFGLEIAPLGSAMYEITAWERPFPYLDDNEVDSRYARGEFPSLGGNVAA